MGRLLPGRGTAVLPAASAEVIFSYKILMQSDIPKAHTLLGSNPHFSAPCATAQASKACPPLAAEVTHGWWFPKQSFPPSPVSGMLRTMSARSYAEQGLSHSRLQSTGNQDHQLSLRKFSAHSPKKPFWWNFGYLCGERKSISSSVLLASAGETWKPSAVPLWDTQNNLRQIHWEESSEQLPLQVQERRFADLHLGLFHSCISSHRLAGAWGPAKCSSLPILGSRF